MLVIKEKIEEVKQVLSPNELDSEFILAFSLDYTKIPFFKSFLSKTYLKEKDFLHFDQELFFHLFQSNISFPILAMTNNFQLPIIIYTEFL